MGLHRQYHTEENNMTQKTTINNNKRIIKPEWNGDGKGNLSSDK